MNVHGTWRFGTRSTKRRPFAERFWEKVEKVNDGCWLWLAARNKHGYGVIGLDRSKRTTLAHRASYELTKGSIPDGLSLDHLCRNPGCVNPSHLEPVTHAENMARGQWKNQASSKRTHCPKGHPYSGKNLIFIVTRSHPNGSRGCRACKNEIQRRMRRERKCLQTQ